MNKPKGTREQPYQILHCMLCAAGLLDSVLSYRRHLANISKQKKESALFRRYILYRVVLLCVALPENWRQRIRNGILKATGSYTGGSFDEKKDCLSSFPGINRSQHDISCACCCNGSD